jgi:hypothetical protein
VLLGDGFRSNRFKCPEAAPIACGPMPLAFTKAGLKAADGRKAAN